MSASPIDMGFADDSDEEREFPQDYRKEIEREANSDGPHAWVCQLLLESLEEGGDS